MPFLGLPDIKTLSRDEAGDQLRFVVESTLVPSCPHCYSTHLHRWTPKKDQHFMDIPTHGKKTAIWLDRKRWKCVSCGKTFLERLDWADESRKMTKRLVKHIQAASLKETFTSLSDAIGVDPKTIKNVFEEYIQTLQNSYCFETPEVLGIDEIHLMKKPRGVITNIREKTIVDILKDRNKPTIINYLKSIDHSKVKLVTMDMWRPYRDAVSEVTPDAQIIVDKFHVVRMANDAMERVRKVNRGKLKPNQRRDLMHDRFILLKRQHELNDSEAFTLSHWINNYEDIATAYHLKESFYGIYEARDATEAYNRYEEWERGLTTDMRPYFDDLRKAVSNWHKEIFSYFSHRHTNAYTESVNNIIRHIDRDGRGYSFEVLRAKVIYTHGIIKQKTFRSGNGYSRDAFMVGKSTYGDMMNMTTATKEKTLYYGADIERIERMREFGQ